MIYLIQQSRKGKTTLRIVKEPDIRKQEILDGAIRIFARKGYDKTTTADIANELKISQGLCYRYYPTKEAIYDAALEKYADLIVEENLQKTKLTMSIKEMVDGITGHMEDMKDAEKENQELYTLFHSKQSQRMHNELFLKVAKKIIPHVQQHLKTAKEKGEISIEDTDGTAIVAIYGWIGLFMTNDLTDQERSQILRSTWYTLLGLK